MTTRSVGRTFVATLALLSGAGLLGADTPPTGAPTPIEQALIENGCVGALPQGALDSASYRECLKTRLSSLRTAFGRDFERLSRAERRQVDDACSSLSTSGREAYLNCLDRELSALLARRQLTALDSADAAAQMMPAAAIPVLRLPPPPPPETTYRSTSLRLAAAAAVGLLMVAAAGARFVFKPRAAQSVCRHCAAVLPAAGDLCASCRHDAAEARRRAALEQQEPSAVRDADEAQRSSIPPRVQDAVFDPYVVLGVMPGATPEEIKAAYEEAKLKFDPSVVSHLGEDVQKHFKLKTSALDRAYQLLVA